MSDRHHRSMEISEPLTEPTLVTREAHPAVIVRHLGVRADQLPGLFDAGFLALAASGVPINGPAFAAYHGDPGATFDLDIGFPVAETLGAPVQVGKLAVRGSELPGGELLGLTHVGPYDTLAQSWDRLATDAAERGLQPSGFFEVYVTEPSPEVDPATLRTDLFLVV